VRHFPGPIAVSSSVPQVRTAWRARSTARHLERHLERHLDTVGLLGPRWGRSPAVLSIVVALSPLTFVGWAAPGFGSCRGLLSFFVLRSPMCPPYRHTVMVPDARWVGIIDLIGCCALVLLLTCCWRRGATGCRYAMRRCGAPTICTRSRRHMYHGHYYMRSGRRASFTCTFLSVHTGGSEVLSCEPITRPVLRLRGAPVRVAGVSSWVSSGVFLIELCRWSPPV
jgi:hypothetical protein